MLTITQTSLILYNLCYYKVIKITASCYVSHLREKAYDILVLQVLSTSNFKLTESLF